MNEAPSLLTTLRRPLAAVALGGMLALSLQGCFAVFAGGALATTFAATDRRTLAPRPKTRPSWSRANRACRKSSPPAPT